MNPVPPKDLTPDRLRQVQQGLRVSLIMVPKVNLMTCRPTDRHDELRRLNVDDFSALPVIDSKDRIIGLYDASQWFREVAPAEAIGSGFAPLNEDILIGADASIFDFLRTADDHPTRLVVQGYGVAGLVSLSDIQQLPARAALFTLITGFEMAMAALISSLWPNGEWQAHLNETRRSILAAKIKMAREQDSYTGDLVLTDFCDKATVIRQAEGLGKSVGWLKQVSKAAQKLRDNLAHGNHFAITTEEAKSVCATVRDVLELQEKIGDLLSSPPKDQWLDIATD